MSLSNEYSPPQKTVLTMYTTCADLPLSYIKLLLFCLSSGYIETQSVTSVDKWRFFTFIQID